MRRLAVWRAVLVGSTLALLLWSAGILLTPVAAASPPLLSRVAAAFYLVGGAVCHQRPERSFHWRGVQLPVCGRCTGLYVAAAAGSLAAWVPRRLRRRRGEASDVRRSLLLVAGVPSLVSWIAEALGSRRSAR